MAARDRYEIKVRCEACGTEGSFKVSENDHAWAGPDFSVDHEPGGFEQVGRAKFVQDFTAKCTGCGEIVRDA